MSLLMKALEKAAKDRVDTAGDAPTIEARATTPPVKVDPELTLEPIAAQAAAAEVPPPPRAPAAPMRKSAAPAMAAATPREPAQAAAVLRAGQREPSGGVVDYLRERPLVVLSTLAVLFLAGFGGYVYMQMNPGMF